MATVFQPTQEQFSVIKSYVNVTWDYEDEQLRDMVNEGVAKIESICGQTDFSNPAAFALLKDYVRLTYNGVRQFFEENFRRELLQLQIGNAISANSGA